MRTNQPGHLKSFDYRGLHRYSLTFCTDYRRSIFVDAGAVTLVHQQILRAAAQEHFAVIAYCFMPDHLHLLIEGLDDNADGLRFIKLAKQYSGFYYSQANRHKLWQRYGFEHVLQEDELTLVVTRYILRNPVRAGLVDDPRKYPFLGSETHSLEHLLETAADVSST
jgi:putative transposase